MKRIRDMAHQEITEVEHVYRGDDQQALPRNVCTVTFDLNSNATTTIERRAHFESPFTILTLPSRITSIADRVFRNCTSLTLVNLPPNITSIGDGTFQGCSSLTSVNLPPYITSIGDGVFRGCSSLTSVDLPPNITFIGDSTFQDCSSLASVDLPPTITSIATAAFQGCSSLASIELPPRINTLGHRVFNFCVALTLVTIPPTITTISDTLFSYCTNLTSITLPDSITTISDNAFYGCSSLASIDLPSTIETIGHWAFNDCHSLTSVHLPESLIGISNEAFQECSQLTTITLRLPGDALVDTASDDCSFFTTTFNSADASFGEILAGAGFYPSDPNLFLYERPFVSQFQTIGPDEEMYYDIKKWARIRNADSRFPLFTAAAKSMRWADMKTIFDHNMPAIYEVDALTGLSLYMLAAVGPNSDIESVYNLLRNNPADTALDIKRWARTRNIDSRLPLCTAAAESVRWADMKYIFDYYMSAVNEVDALTGLPLYMLAAVGPTSDIESVYNLLRENPASLALHADPLNVGWARPTSLGYGNSNRDEETSEDEGEISCSGSDEESDWEVVEAMYAGCSDEEE